MEISSMLYLIGSSMYIIVGLLHTMTHYKELIANHNAQKIKSAGAIDLMGKKADVWKLWQGFSLGFGLLMGAVGIINILALYQLEYGAQAPFSICLVNLFIMIMVIYMGNKFFEKPQFYGGIIGFFIFGTALLMRIL